MPVKLIAHPVQRKLSSLPSSPKKMEKTLSKLKLLFYLPAVFAVASCRDNTRNVPFPVEQTSFHQPVVTPLKFSEPKKIIWTNGKVTPLVKPFDLDKLPSKPYDTTGFKPFKYPVKETKFDYNSLPSKDLDINKLPSRPFKFQSTLLPAPRFIKAGPLHLKNKNNANLYELSEDQGLKGKSITSLFKDSDGLLWIATYKGVYRYDGVNLLLYLKYPGSPIFAMLQDQSGRIWIGLLGGGVVVLDPKTGVLNTLSKKQGLINDYVTTMVTDIHHNIWVGCTGGINIIDPENQTVKILDKTVGLSANDAFWLVCGPANSIWLSTYTGLNVIDLNNNKIKYIKKKQGLQSDSIYSVFNDRRGRIWVTYINGKAIDVVDPRRGVIRSVKEISRTFYPNFSQDKTGNIWLADNWGIKIIDLEKLKIKNLDISKGFQGDASGKAFAMEQQNDGQTWIGTEDGLAMLKSNTILAAHIGNDLVGSMAEDDQGLVWKADYTGNGMDILDRKTGVGRHLTAKQGLTSDNIGQSTLIKGRIFTGSDNGLNIIDPVKKTITDITQKQGLNFKEVRLVSEGENGNLWILGSGLAVYDPKSGTVKHPATTEKTGNLVPSDIAFDAKKNIWLALDGDNGVGAIGVIDPETETVKLLDLPALKSEGKVLLADKNGNIWAGSPNGLYIINVKNNTVTSLTTENGLIDDNVNSLQGYNDNIYAGTDKGITVITPPADVSASNGQWKITSFGTEFGIRKTTLGNIQSDMITKDGLYWWGDEGMTVLDLSKKMGNTLRGTFITGLNIEQKPLYFAAEVNNQMPSGRGYVLKNKVRGPYNMPVDLRLPHNQNYLQFRFASFSSTSQDSTWYRYILEGADKKWSDKTVSTSTGDYFNLSPGTYTFKVASKGANGLWGKPDEFTFTIIPPWWLTWWAYIFYVLVAGGLVWVIVYYRSRHLLRENQLLEEKIHARTHELRDANEELKEQKEEILTQRDELSKTLTDLKSTQSQLVQREKMASLGELTAGIAHEIQNPLNFVNNFSDVSVELVDEMQSELKNGNQDEAIAISDDIKQNLEKIRHHGKRADFIVKGMLQHSRTSTGEKQLTNINTLADEFLKLSYHGLRAKDKNFKAEMVTHFDKGVPKINVVQQDIGRVLLNLFNNAFYAVNDKKKTAGADYEPEVSVTTAFENMRIIIKVKDNGNGIPDAIKDKIMQPFFTTKPTGEGTGLGLSLSYDIVVKGHGGSIAVDAKESEFAEFTVSLPLA
jgi:signal transduction histidine kinase/ligand-binding sensor domain-containing protein